MDGRGKSHCPQRGWHENQLARPSKPKWPAQDAASCLLVRYEYGTVLVLGFGTSSRLHGRRLTPHNGSLLKPALTTAINLVDTRGVDCQSPYRTC